MLRALGAASEALWMPDVCLFQAELNARAVWGAVAAPPMTRLPPATVPLPGHTRLPHRRAGLMTESPSYASV
jgi:hypothetical protein